jgi:hypothetical protein
VNLSGWFTPFHLLCRLYADLAGPETAAKYQTPIFLAASASAEVIADVALCPWEAVKVRLLLKPLRYRVWGLLGRQNSHARNGIFCYGFVSTVWRTEVKDEQEAMEI